MALPAADYDSGIAPTITSLTNDGFTVVGCTDVPAGVKFADASADSVHIAWTETDSWWLNEFVVAAIPTSTTLRGLSAITSAGLYSRDFISHVLSGGWQRTYAQVDGAAIYSPTLKPVIVNIGDILRVIHIERLANARYAEVYISGPTYLHPFSDVALSATVRTNLCIGANGRHTGAVPVILTRCRRWDDDPTSVQIGRALAGDPAAFIAGNSATVTTAPVLAFNAKGSTTITVDITHATSATGAIVHYRTDKPGSAWTRYTSNPVTSGTVQFQITGLTANETYLVVAEPYDSVGSVGLESNILRVPLGTTGESSF